MEARGKQDLWLHRKPEVLAALREQAIIQSAESSNRIEGVTVAANRLRPVVLGEARPRDRSEEELAGYRRALDWIFRLKRPTAPTAASIRKLHSLAQGGHSGDAGEWKAKDNDIVEVLPDGRRSLRFRPASAKQTPALISQLCRDYQLLSTQDQVPPLILAATFVFDFLCIHPFRDGNGRVSRLLTSWLLKATGFEAVRYVSLERLVEERKTDYYAALLASSTGWHEGANDIVPWWNFFLSILRDGYREWERQVESASARPGKSDLIRSAILEQASRFTLADLALQFPAASPPLIRKVVQQLKRDGKVRLQGRGRGAVWELLP
jgi:Fic family protein